MLATLKIRDLVLIEDVSLDFAGGLNVLTGETGAGKSILLDALGLAAGARAGGRSSVRQGAAQGSAVAIFDLAKGHAARALIDGNGIPSEGETILRRAITVDGRTRAFVNDEAVGVGLLRDLGAMLVEIHGQADDRGLFDAATHRRLLDAFGGHEPLAADVASRFAELDRLRAAADAIRKAAASAAADADFVRHAAQELSDFAPEEGEETRLASERALLMNASRIAEDVSAGVEALGGDRGAEAMIASVLKRLARMGEEARKAAASAEAALEQAFASTEEGRRELEALLSRLDADPGELERKEERLFALRAMARKYAVPPDELPRVAIEFFAKRDAIEGGGGKLKEAEAEVAKAREAYLAAARKLSAARKTAAAKLEAAVAGELVPLKLGHAKFRVALEPGEESASGLERVAFEVATIEGAPFGAMTKIASGGELARFSLAIKVALAETSPPAALVFDEVDRGVGGAVADAVGERLQRVARTTQVLLVTHSPQVAARAMRHFRITRTGDRTRVAMLTPEERAEEIARMLSGAAVTEEARAAARRLLAEAEAAPKKIRKRA
ncbi:MAG TPA: DNA repair protein RecN [Rhizomicrobium sp.]|jgi:DNA repair protein RecN (Recombination protein N)|nr:DNA repair protein RecN [Rhizomicrobium sp.]